MTIRALEPGNIDFNDCMDRLNRLISTVYGLPPDLLRRYYQMPAIKPDWRSVFGLPVV